MTLFGQAHSSQYMEWHNLGIIRLKHMLYIPHAICPTFICFSQITGKPNNYQFYLPNSLKFWNNNSYKLLTPSKLMEKFIEILE